MIDFFYINEATEVDLAKQYLLKRAIVFKHIAATR